MDKNALLRKLETEVRFFLFMEKEPNHRVFASPTLITVFFTVVSVLGFVLAYFSLLILAAVGAFYTGLFAVIIILGILEPFHYACDRSPLKIEQQDFNRQGSGREKSERAVYA